MQLIPTRRKPKTQKPVPTGDRLADTLDQTEDDKRSEMQYHPPIEAATLARCAKKPSDTSIVLLESGLKRFETA